MKLFFSRLSLMNLKGFIFRTVMPGGAFGASEPIRGRQNGELGVWVQRNKLI